MSSGGVNRTAVGNTSNKMMDTVSTTGDQFNTQLQNLFSQSATNPLASAGAGALSGFQDMATTGGYSPTQISAMKDEGTEAARSTYQTAGDQYQRTLAATGGYGPSADATASLARQGSNAASKAAVSTDAAIAQSQAGNRLAGMQGMSSLAGLNAAQQQQLLNTILGNRQETDTAQGNILNTQLGIAKMPGTASFVNQDIMGLINAASKSGAFAAGGTFGN
jgi:hypothetical protein